MKQSPERITRQTYDKIAKRFAKSTSNIDVNLSQRMERFVQQLPNTKPILDLGCGPGRDLRWFHTHGKIGVGIDISAGMLQEARKGNCISLSQAKMCDLPFANHSFSGIWCNSVLMHIPKSNLPHALKEIRRVLTPGGVFYFNVVQGKGETIEKRLFIGKQRFFARYLIDEMENYLHAAGFEIHRKVIHEYKRTWLWFECISAC